MLIERFPLGAMQANCYLIWNNHKVLMVDPGGTSKRVAEHILSKGGELVAILLTHGHFDHSDGVNFFLKFFDCPVYISEEDAKIVNDFKLNCANDKNHPKINKKLSYYTTSMHLDGFSFEVVDAPGHTNGSVLLVFDTAFIMSGDVLFKESVGRCDLPTGSNTKMWQTLRYIKTMDPNYLVYPGHGEMSSLQEELINNPFLVER